MPHLDPDLWVRLQKQFNQLADATQAERAARLAELQHSDPELATELSALLDADAKVEQLETLTRRVTGAVRQMASEVETGDKQPAWIGDYRVTGTLGSGGMGVVYLAEQESPRRTVALKVIRSFGGGTAVRRFQREAQLHGRLQHPGIALVHEAGLAAERDADGKEFGPPRPFFVMEYVRGEPVNSFVQSHHLDVTQRVEIMAKICDAIEHAHSRNVIHRDLKSANVLVGEDGNPKVLDFGIARAVDRDGLATTFTAVGEVVGTLPYMSPEQVSGSAQAATPQSDIYALGVVFFEMLTGRRPLDLAGRSLPEAVRIVTTDEPTRLGSIDRALRGDLETIVGRCLEKDPRRRYQSAGALAADLRRHLEHRPIEARPASTFYQISKFTRRHRPLVVGASTAFVALLAATVVSIVMAVKAENARAEMEKQLNQTRAENTRSVQGFNFLRTLITSADPTLNGGQDPTVREMVRRAVDELETSTEEDAQVTGQLARFIGYTLFRIGDLEPAERVLRQSVELLRKHDPTAWQPEERLVESLLSLADVLDAQGRSEEALVLLDEAVALRDATTRRIALEREPRADPSQVRADEQAEPFLNVALRSQGLVLHALGRYAEAERALDRACEMERTLVGMGWARKGSLATTLMCRARTKLTLGQAVSAVSDLRTALELQRASSGEESFLTQTVRNQLGLALLDLGNYGEALQVLERAKKYRKLGLPRDHYETAMTDLLLAKAKGMAGFGVEGLTLAAPAAETIKHVHQAAAPNCHRADIIVGELQIATGDFQGALDRADARLKVIWSKLKPNLLAIAEAELIRAQAHRQMGHLDSAMQSATEAVEDARKAVGERHLMTLAARQELALVQRAAGNLTGAGQELRAVVKDAREALAANHPVIAIALVHLAEVELALGDSSAAALLASQAEEIFTKHVDLAPSLSERATALQK